MRVLAPALTAIIVPLLLVTYWLTAGCVMPRRSEIVLWDKPRVASCLAVSQRMVGRIRQTAISQGDRCAFMTCSEDATLYGALCTIFAFSESLMIKRALYTPHTHYNNCYIINVVKRGG